VRTDSATTLNRLRYRLTRLPWPRLIAMLGLVIAAVTLLEVAYSSAPVPPGVDPGDWITRGGAFVGLPVPPSAAFGGAYIYPPLLFPFLGALLVLTGSPLATGFVAGGAVLLFFGLSVIYVAIRFLRFGPLQVAFVGGCVFSATLLYMLIWGAYPNFFAFVFLNLSLVYLLAFVRAGDSQSGFLLGVSLALLYLTHSLTFTIGAVTVVVAGALVLTVGGPRFLWKRLRNRGLLLGALVLVATVVLYSLALREAGIVPPNYLESNPAALTLDNVGQIFVPLAVAPMFFPAGGALYLSPNAAMLTLGGSAVGLVTAHTFVHRYRPAWLNARHTVAVAAVVAALITPVLGSIARVGTDYPRFVYFLPVPITLLIVVTLDSIVARYLALHRVAPSEYASRPVVSPNPRRATLAYAYVAVGVVLVLLFTNVTAPAVIEQENVNTGVTHSSDFVAAADWLASNPNPGSVLTLQGTARWIEALTGRGAYDESDSWLDFETWEIVNTQSTFWALNSQYAVTDGTAIESYTPVSTPLMSQSPMYSVYDAGVVFPILRLLPGDLNATVSTPTGVISVAGDAWRPDAVAVNSTTGVGVVSFSNPWFNATVTGDLGSPGEAGIRLTVEPLSNDSMKTVTVALGSPPADVALLHAPSSQSVFVTSNGFSWVSAGTLGQLPAPASINTTGTYSPAPASSTISTFPVNATLASTFAVPPAARSFTVDLNLSTPGTGNPGITLPLVLDSSGFLQSRNIHFLFLNAGSAYAPTIAFYQTVFGFTTVYLNAQWEILEGGSP
jgi:hypothetical protein